MKRRHLVASLLTYNITNAMTRKQRYQFLLDYFKEQMPEVSTELHYASPFQLLVATVLSAQCTDKRINEVTPALFNRFPDAQKAKHLLAMAQMLMTDFGGEVPSDPKRLVSLPGVGRKTANVVQAVAFGKSTMAVDTHVFRVSRRMGLVRKTDDTPLKVEMELMRNIPADDVPRAHHWLLLHGRYVCTSRAPHCDKCDFNAFCPKLMDGDKLSK